MDKDKGIDSVLRLLEAVSWVRALWYISGDEYMYAMMMCVIAIMLNITLFQRVTKRRLKEIEGMLKKDGDV